MVMVILGILASVDTQMTNVLEASERAEQSTVDQMWMCESYMLSTNY